MCKILIFGGTTEGRKLAEFCNKNKIKAYISVATEYGAEQLENTEYIKILTGRLNSIEIINFIIKNNIKAVIDATHPYAVEVTKNIKNSCEQTKIKYFRILRENITHYNQGKFFQNIKSVVKYLNNKNGKIFITTGSKELENFCVINNFIERCVIRVIPNDKIINKCISLGFDKSRIIAEKGPFSEEQNINQMKKYNIKYLVTKDSGEIGGFDAKIAACKKLGAEILIIKRPEETGISLEDTEKILLLEQTYE